MKTAAIQELSQGYSTILAWLQEGETILLLQNGQPLGRIVPEPKPKVPHPQAETESEAKVSARREVFARYVASLLPAADRDLSGILAENRGDDRW